MLCRKNIWLCNTQLCLTHWSGFLYSIAINNLLFEINTRNEIIFKNNCWGFQRIILQDNFTTISSTCSGKWRSTSRVVSDKLYYYYICKIEDMWGWNQNCNHRGWIQYSDHDFCWKKGSSGFGGYNRQIVGIVLQQHQITVDYCSGGLIVPRKIWTIEKILVSYSMGMDRHKGKNALILECRKHSFYQKRRWTIAVDNIYPHQYKKVMGVCKYPL